jgi:S-methyl-5-thioribose-1-phosphate isomerase
MKVNNKHYRTVWMEKGVVKLIDQRLIPDSFKILTLRNHRETALSIKNMAVRGAGAIGGAAGFAMAQAVLEAPKNDFLGYIKEAEKRIKDTRPTAQNLFYAVDRVLSAIKKTNLVSEAKKLAVKEAQQIADDDANACKKIGINGAKLIKNGFRILTHCNAGWLAFVDYGSALSPVYEAHRQGKKVFVFADETRPWLQGSRLTAWELYNEKVPFAVIADNASGYFMWNGEVDMVITGADRIAANGDAANKIGTYEKAVLAKENGIPFYIAAPTSTIDLKCKSGRNIKIEERNPEEVLSIKGNRIAPKGVSARNPVFDVTPAKYIKGIITEKGIVKTGSVRKLFK